MIGRWSAGVIFGTAIVLGTSPLFVRSYVPRVYQPVRDAVVLRPGQSYRWRNEGYATTVIGPLGMPGQNLVTAPGGSPHTVGLWGDSQAEGVSVADEDKIASAVRRRSQGSVFVYPFAKSGDDANDWIHQINTTETAEDLPIRTHVFLVTELSDWAVEAATPATNPNATENWISEHLPDGVIHAARNVLTSGSDSQRRTLRFRPGPVARPEPDPEHVSDRDESLQRIQNQLGRLRSATRKRCVFLYAPRVPAIVDGSVVDQDPDARLYRTFAKLCREHSFDVVDLREVMRRSVIEGRWPRGFHNGQFGVGHYNRIGNGLIADALVESVATTAPTE